MKTSSRATSPPKLTRKFAIAKTLIVRRF
jgi:hypothetical protein